MAAIRNLVFANRVFLSELNAFKKCVPVRNYSSNARFNSKVLIQSNVGLIAVGIGGGIIVGAGLSWRKFQAVKPPVLNNAIGKDPIVLQDLPAVRIARKVVSPTDSTNLKLVLFQYPTCPFCCKVRAFLDYYGFSYDVVEVDPVLRTEMKWTDYKKVPVLLAKVDGGYQQLNDSSMIISALKSFLQDRQAGLTEFVKCYPTMDYRDDSGYLKTEIMNRYYLMFNSPVPEGKGNEAILEERKWRKWADDSLVHTLSPNVYRTREEALQAFHWFSEVGEWERLFPTWERVLIVYSGALAMWVISKRLKKRYQLKDDVRQSLYDDCNTFTRELKRKGTDFIGGDKPNLADLAVYGVLSSIEGCIAFDDLKRNTSIADWYYRTQQLVIAHKGTQEIVR